MSRLGESFLTAFYLYRRETFYAKKGKQELNTLAIDHQYILDVRVVFFSLGGKGKREDGNSVNWKKTKTNYFRKGFQNLDSLGCGGERRSQTTTLRGFYDSVCSAPGCKQGSGGLCLLGDGRLGAGRS